MQKKENRYFFHNPNQKEEMEKRWISLLVEMYTPRLREKLEFQKSRDKLHADFQVRRKDGVSG